MKFEMSLIDIKFEIVKTNGLSMSNNVLLICSVSLSIVLCSIEWILLVCVLTIRQLKIIIVKEYH